MNWLLNIPISRKLTLISILASTSALLLAGAIIVAYDTVSYRTQVKQDAAVRAGVIATNVSASLVFDDAKAAHESLSALRSSPDVTAAAVYDARGHLLTSYLPLGTSTPVPSKPEAQGMRFNRSELTVFWPVIEKPEQVGTVYLRIKTEPLLTRILRYGSIILLVMLGSLLITLPVGRRLHVVITEPLLKMTEDARQIAAGEIVVRPQDQPRADELGSRRSQLGYPPAIRPGCAGQYFRGHGEQSPCQGGNGEQDRRR